MRYRPSRSRYIAISIASAHERLRAAYAARNSPVAVTRGLCTPYHQRERYLGGSFLLVATSRRARDDIRHSRNDFDHLRVPYNVTARARHFPLLLLQPVLATARREAARNVMRAVISSCVTLIPLDSVCKLRLLPRRRRAYARRTNAFNHVH